MEQGDGFCMEDDVLGSEQGEEFAGESSCPTQGTVV